MKHTLIKSLLIATLSVLATYFAYYQPPFSKILGYSTPQGANFWLMTLLVVLVSMPELYRSRANSLGGITKLFALSLLFTAIIFIGTTLLTNDFSIL